MRPRFKAWAEPYLKAHSEITLSVEQINSLPNYYLEIGAGKGNFLCNMALKLSDKIIIGLEKNVTCAGITAKKIVEQQIANAKLIHQDAGVLLPLLKGESVLAIFLNFSDPWPKKRHHKNRLTSEKYLVQYHRLLKSGGRVYMKTDNVDFFNYSLELASFSKFNILSVDRNYDGLDQNDEMTEYEQNFRLEGLPIYRLILEKV
ncbi:MAG: tRNA (guanosine(46)-N7)-methyltransferase TrmB [Erysipelotrichia bacterium]|nr:tRNA (guanosine(46)-N7)-methyltransferase TrmB [Erysipelotrichia bacterium]